MRGSMRRSVSVALLLSYLVVVPLCGIIYWRLDQAVAALEQAPAKQPGLRPARYLDLAVRDITVYLALYAVLALLLLAWVRRRVSQPTRQLENVLARLSDGDLDVRIPLGAGGEMRRLAELLKTAVERFDRRDQLKSHKVLELRTLVERLIEAVAHPVLVVGADIKIDFANAAAAEALGEELADMPGAELERLRGGEPMCALVEQALVGSDIHSESELALGPDRVIVHCGLVRDHAGEPTRVVLVLRNPEGWWTRLWNRAGTERQPRDA